MFNEVVDFIRSIYGDGFIPLHEPRFIGNEKKYLNDCIDSTFVSSVGQYVDDSEIKLAEVCKSKYAVLCSNGTSALHVALRLAGVEAGDEVITQSLSFIATANAITYLGARPIFIDVDEDTLGLSPASLRRYLENNAELKNGRAVNKKTGRTIRACVPMHTFGHAVRIDTILDVCEEWGIEVVEDAAEAIGSDYKGKKLGTHAKIAAVSFNGNKVITSGGGGAILLQDEVLAKHGKHLTTTAKVPHRWDFVHDEIGYNYRMPNLNAALLLAQMEMLSSFLKNKRETAEKYREFFEQQKNINFFVEPDSCHSNYWLNAVRVNNRVERDKFLNYTNDNGVMTRPIWMPTSKLSMYKDCETADLSVTQMLEDTIVNIPSSVIV